MRVERLCYCNLQYELEPFGFARRQLSKPGIHQDQRVHRTLSEAKVRLSAQPQPSHGTDAAYSQMQQVVEPKCGSTKPECAGSMYGRRLFVTVGLDHGHRQHKLVEDTPPRHAMKSDTQAFTLN